MSFERYPKPAVAVDLVLLYWDGASLSVPLVRRGSEPFKGRWALPGGFLEMDETLEEAARRELREETNLEVGTLLRGPLFDAVDRDPRGRVISVPHVAIVPYGEAKARHGSDAADVSVYPLDALPSPLAFDHDRIVAEVCRFAGEEVGAGRLARELPDDERALLARALRGRRA